MSVATLTAWIMAAALSRFAPTASPTLNQQMEELGAFTVTSYQSVARQTDTSPFFTSIGERTNVHGVAVSADQLCKVNKQCRRNVKTLCDPTRVHYQDLIFIEGVGWKFVNDVMAPRHKQRFDVWVGSQAEEAAFHKKFGHKKLRVWRPIGREHEHAGQRILQHRKPV